MLDCIYYSSSKSIFLKTPAKLNLYLNILSKRKDGYYNICSIIERIALFDDLKLFLNNVKRVRLFCNVKELNNPSNLAFRACELFRRSYKISEGVDIFLNKNIPPGSGLGGASSNCAGVLLGLSKLFKLGLSLNQLYRLGEKLGSDVNFFLGGISFALALGRGEKIYPLETGFKISHLLILPNFSSSTAKVYKAYNLNLTTSIDNAKLIIYSLEKKDKAFLEKLIFNALTKPFLKIYPEGREIFEIISQREDYSFSLTGAGSAIFLLYKQKLGGKIYKSLKKLGVKFLQVFTF